MSCSFPGCKKKEFKDGYCASHLPKPKKADAPVYTVALGRVRGATEVNATFASTAESTAASAPYKNRIEHLRSLGPASGGEESVHGISCLHDTQKANNCTVWYSWQGNAMTVWGLGSHSGGSGAGNKKYTMLWCDGTNKNWTRPG